MYQSWKEHRLISTETVNTIADGIAMRVPVAEALEDLQSSIDDILLVDDDKIIAAMKHLKSHAGLLVEPAGASALAALLSDNPVFNKQRVAVVLCGSNMTEQQIQDYGLNQ